VAAFSLTLSKRPINNYNNSNKLPLFQLRQTAQITGHAGHVMQNSADISQTLPVCNKGSHSFACHPYTDHSFVCILPSRPFTDTKLYCLAMTEETACRRPLRNGAEGPEPTTYKSQVRCPTNCLL